MRLLIIAALMGLLIAGCVNPPQQNQTNRTGPPVLTVPNGTGQPDVTGQQNASTALPPDYSVSLGDYVSVIYSLRVDGEVIDTNNATLANESGIYSPARKYQPFNFTVQFNEGVIDGFIINVVGMRMNETITFSVPPERGYGPYDPKKVVVVPRYYNKSLYETVPRSYFEAQGLAVENGTSFETAYGPVFVSDLNDENVTIFYVLKPNSGFIVNGLPQKVASLDNLTATIEYMLAVNETYRLPDPSTGAQTTFTVVDKTDQNITIDSNHPLANKTLDFKVTLIGAVPAKR
ncbi:MAG: FKBP-type peptidyl-prolyl cis-trans isomerase [Candidatus Micrarchaeota archaeon]